MGEGGGGQMTPLGFQTGGLHQTSAAVKYYPSIDGASKYAVFTAGKILPLYIADKVLPQYRRYI